MASCTAGQLPIRHADLQVEIKITAHHKGHFEFSICRLGLRIKVLQGGSCVFVQYLFGCRLHSSRMFWYVPPNLFSRCFSGANIRFLTFFRLGMPLYYTFGSWNSGSQGAPWSQIWGDKEITSSLSNAQGCLDEHILLRASAQDAACRWGIRWGMGHPP